MFRGRWALYLMWCKADRFYVCRRCWEWECREGHGRGRASVGIAAWEAALLVLMFWALVGPPSVAAMAYGTSLSLLFGIAVNLPFLAGLAWAVREHRRRADRHAAATRSLRVVEIHDERIGFDEAMPWRPNGGLRFQERIMAATTLSAASAAVAVIAATVLGPSLEAGGRVGLGLFIGMVLSFLVVFPIGYAIDTGPRPRAMALTERGIHFWFPTPEERRLADGFVEWREIAFIGIRRVGKSQWRALERTNGVSDTIDFLAPESWKALGEEWSRRRPPSSS